LTVKLPTILSTWRKSVKKTNYFVYYA